MILDEIAAATRVRVEAAKREKPLEQVSREARSLTNTKDYPFEKELKKEGISFICEVKKASPSKGIIVEEFNYCSIAKEYEKAGAGAVSVLTEPDYFKGNLSYLSEIKKQITIPVLRKDFTIDEYMIYNAKIAGADAVLLICAMLSEAELIYYRELCDSLGLSALVEAHDAREVEMALTAGARIIGVNNRDLKTFQVDARNCLRLRKYIPRDILFVAESGVSKRQDIVDLEAEHINGVLIGETLMKSKDKKCILNELKGISHDEDKNLRITP